VAHGEREDEGCGCGEREEESGGGEGDREEEGGGDGERGASEGSGRGEWVVNGETRIEGHFGKLMIFAELNQRDRGLLPRLIKVDGGSICFQFVSNIFASSVEHKEPIIRNKSNLLLRITILQDLI
jgi:hypothetical protein